MSDKQALYQLINEAILLENNMADLYSHFASLFPEDERFWWTLVMEEKNHAALLRSGKESFMPAEVFPDRILPSSLEQLKEANRKVTHYIREMKDHPPTRAEAFQQAYQMELSAGEYHYQVFMSKAAEKSVDRVFKELNQGDKDHAERINKYMEQHGI